MTPGIYLRYAAFICERNHNDIYPRQLSRNNYRDVISPTCFSSLNNMKSKQYGEISRRQEYVLLQRVSFIKNIYIYIYDKILCNRTL